MKKLFLTIIFILFATTLYAKAINITFVWDKNIESDLAGYNLYQSTVSNNYSGDPSAIIMGDTNQYTYQTDMVSGTPSYFVLTAFDDSGNESGYSNEVPHVIYIDANAPAAPMIFHIKNYVIIQ